MASLNTSSEGAAISKSYQTVVDTPLPTGAAAASATYSQWVVYSVAAPLTSAFQQDSSKESLLRVQSTGEGELVDLVDEFSDGKIQFAFAKVKDPNTSLPKSVLIGWCGEGVPERTKGYFTSHLAAVSSLLHGYHVQVTARTDNDLTPEGIIQKVADASGSKYSGGAPVAAAASKPPPPVASKPVFTPTRVGGTSAGFRTLGSRTQAPGSERPTDSDGWGDDAPQVTRTQLEKVDSAYRPTKVDMASLTSQKPEASRFQAAPRAEPAGDVVRGAYQPVGKVDIAAIRRQAADSGNLKDERPTTVKGAYEPVGKVDIAAIRARAQGPGESVAPPPPSNEQDEPQRSLADRSAAFTASERITTLPKPAVAKKFGSGAGTFAGTRAPAPGGFEEKRVQSSAPVGIASKTFADEGGKTPAQIWAEKKARERGNSGAGSAPYQPSTAAVSPQASGGAGGWQSGYTGKKWGAVQTTRTGASAASGGDSAQAGEEAQDDLASGAANVSAIRDRFRDAEPEQAPVPPPMDISSKPNAGAARGVPMPGLPTRPAEEHVRVPSPPPQPPRSPTPPTPPATTSSPIRLAQPVGRGQDRSELEAPEERFEATPVPGQALSQAISAHQDMDDEPQSQAHDTARATAEAAAATTFGESAVSAADPGAHVGGKRALIQYDYDKQEDNEIDLVDGEYVTNIDMVDEDWWLGENSKGERGLFPANYVEVVEESQEGGGAVPAPEPAAEPAQAPASSGKQTATAQYDYTAEEDNELTFPDGAKITNIEFPDEDWWLGEYNGRQGLFPANYVELDPQ